MRCSALLPFVSIAHAGSLMEMVDRYSCGSCCSAFDVCHHLSRSDDLHACLKVLPKGCIITSASHLKVIVDNSKVCPPLVDHQAASDYVTFSTSDLTSTHWGQFADRLNISNVLWTNQDGCSYTMIANSAPADFPTVCSSPTIDATSKNVAKVELTSLGSGKGFTLQLNSQLPLTDVEYISLKATGKSCTPFTVQGAPIVDAIIPITVNSNGEAIAARKPGTSSTVARIDTDNGAPITSSLVLTLIIILHI